MTWRQMILKAKGSGADFDDPIHHHEVRCSQADGDCGGGDGVVGGGGYGDEKM